MSRIPSACLVLGDETLPDRKAALVSQMGGSNSLWFQPTVHVLQYQDASNNLDMLALRPAEQCPQMRASRPRFGSEHVRVSKHSCKFDVHTSCTPFCPRVAASLTCDKLRRIVAPNSNAEASAPSRAGLDPTLPFSSGTQPQLQERTTQTGRHAPLPCAYRADGAASEAVRQLGVSAHGFETHTRCSCSHQSDQQ